jgi:DNA-binding LacI/PurR family transcriptional regulator
MCKRATSGALFFLKVCAYECAKSMSVTSKDIARELKLSQPTVSRILSGDLRHRASDDTRRRVLDTARRLGYRTNAVASSLRRGRTGIIGLHTNHNYDARNEFFGSIIGGLQCACNARGLDLLLHSALHGRPAEEMFDRLRDGRVDGLILHSSSDDPLVAMLGESSLLVVSVADNLPGMAGVTCDDEDGMRQLLEHLWKRGYRRFKFLAPSLALPSVEKRRVVFEAELKRRRLPAAARQIRRIEFENAAPVSDELSGECTAICCWNDRTAYNFLHECAKRGVRVPKEVAVAGFDGFLDDKMPGRQLLTVGCPWPDVASQALSVLVKLIEARSNGETPLPREIRLPVTLLKGDTA